MIWRKWYDQHKPKKKSETYYIQQPEDMTWNMDHLLKYRNVVYAVRTPNDLQKKTMKMFGILVDNHPHLHGLWKLGTPKSSKSSKSKGFSWFLLVSHHFSLLKLTFNEVFPHVQTQIVEVSNLPTPQSFQRPETLHRRRRTSTRKRCGLEPSKIAAFLSSHGAMAKKKKSFKCTSRT